MSFGISSVIVITLVIVVGFGVYLGITFIGTTTTTSLNPGGSTNIVTTTKTTFSINYPMSSNATNSFLGL